MIVLKERNLIFLEKKSLLCLISHWNGFEIITFFRKFIGNSREKKKVLKQNQTVLHTLIEEQNADLNEKKLK